MRFVKRVLSRGTLTLPSDVRKSLQIREGDIVEVEIRRVIRKETLSSEIPDEDLVTMDARETAEVDA